MSVLHHTMNIWNNFSAPNIKTGRKSADHKATLKCPECPGCREVIAMDSTEQFWHHIITPQGLTVSSKISSKKHRGGWGRGSQQMCRSLWINFFLTCSLWSSHFIGVLRCPQGALPSCGVGTINTLSTPFKGCRFFILWFNHSILGQPDLLNQWVLFHYFWQGLDGVLPSIEKWGFTRTRISL